MKTLKIVPIVVITLMCICLVFAQTPNPSIVTKNVPGYGDVTITIKSHNPSLLELLFGNIFSIYFEQSSAQVGEQVGITGSLSRISGICSLDRWELYIVKNGVETSIGDFNNDYNDYGNCNLEVYAAWAAGSTGTYSLRQKYKWTTSTSTGTEEGTNTVVVTSATGTCDWTSWMTFNSITNGVVQYKSYSGTGDCNQDDQYRTSCNSGYYCSGTTSQLCDGINTCILNQACTPSWTCGDYSACYGGTQTRACTDSNNCGVTTGRPELQKSCSNDNGTNPSLLNQDSKTFSELTSLNSIDLSKSICFSNSDCKAREGYIITCDKEVGTKLLSDKIANDCNGVIDAMTGNIPIISGFISKSACLLPTTAVSVIITAMDVAGYKPGVCKAESTGLGKYWDILLESLYKLGIPSNWILPGIVITIVIILLIIFK
jgi:hypothetical protein